MGHAKNLEEWTPRRPVQQRSQLRRKPHRKKAASAGLLSAEAMEAMLREQLRRRAGEALQAMWQRGPQEELTPQTEQEIVEEVRKVRAEGRLRGAS